jgi:hypothetical protein
VELLSKYHGFTICIEKETVMCKRKGKNKTPCAYVNGALKADCKFHFKLASLETKKYLRPNSTVKKWGTKRGRTCLHRFSLGALGMESSAHQIDQKGSDHQMSTTREICQPHSILYYL